jgi:hypothetical protein
MLKKQLSQECNKKECKKESTNDSKVNTNTRTCQKPARPEGYFF